MELSGLTGLLDTVDAKDSITLPFRGVEYVVPAPGTARRLRCAALLAAYRLPVEERPAAIAKVLDEDRVEDMVLGVAAAERLHGDDVPAKVISYLTTVALVAWVQGEAAAQAYIDASTAGEPGPKAKAPSKASKTGTSTGAASTTKRRASTSGTTSRRSASPKGQAKAAPARPSTGGTSSPAGPSS